MKKLIEKIKDTFSILSSSKGFTLLELLVVVLIIGILTAIALPQYKMAVTKAKVASILPLMRRWKDALQEYKLQHGDYNVNDASALGVNWPSDWKHWDSNNSCGNSLECKNGYWNCGIELPSGKVYCGNKGDGYFNIYMYQPDDPDCEICRDKVTCYYDYSEPMKVCKALGSKEIYDDGVEGEYQL